MKEPTFRIENGRRIYTLDTVVEAVRRPFIPPNAVQLGATDAGFPPEVAMLSKPLESAAVDPDIVRVRVRLISAQPAYPTLGWFGPQRVHYDHNEGAVIRQIVPNMRGRNRPVPVMWDHSYDMKDKAGHLDRPEWEDSVDIPYGPNADIVVNRRYDPKAAVGLETGEINATSISIRSEMELSHPDLPFDTFVELAGSGGVIDGRPVAWLPVTLKEVLHHALVWEGADPHSGPRQTNAEKTKRWFNSTDISVGIDTTRLSDDLRSIRKSLDNLQSETTAEAVNNNNKTRGGITVEHKSIEILDSLCRDMGFDVILSDESGIPNDLHARMAKRVADLQAAATRYRELEARLSRLSDKHLAGAQFASAIERLDALSVRLDLAAHGEHYINDLRDTALKAFDTAHFSPDGIQTLAVKKLRELISKSDSAEELKAFAAEYQDQAAKALGDTRTSRGEDLPPETTQAELSAQERRILAAYDRWNGGK